MQIRLPTKNNPLKAGKLIVDVDGIIYGNRRYSFNDILHIYFLWQNFTTHYVGTPHSLDGGAGGRMIMRLETDGLRSTIKTKTSTWIDHEAEKFDEFYSAYLYLLKKTYEKRLSLYLEELEVNGYFTYDEKRFFKNGHVESGRKYVNIKNCKIFTRSYLIELVIKEGIVEKVKQDLMGMSLSANIFIKTTIDQDVIFMLLESLYGRKLR